MISVFNRLFVSNVSLNDLPTRLSGCSDRNRKLAVRLGELQKA